MNDDDDDDDFSALAALIDARDDSLKAATSTKKNSKKISSEKAGDTPPPPPHVEVSSLPIDDQKVMDTQSVCRIEHETLLTEIYESECRVTRSTNANHIDDLLQKYIEDTITEGEEDPHVISLLQQQQSKKSAGSKKKVRNVNVTTT
jgi:hypothetical protein